MRFRLRTLMIVLALAPLVGAIGYVQFASHLAWRHRKDGPLIYQARFVGNRAYSDKKLVKIIDVKSGVRLNTYTSGQSLRKIVAFYHEQGYPRAEVTLLEGDRSGDRNLAFQIVEGEKRSP